MRWPRVGDWPVWQRDGLMAAACFVVGSLLLMSRLPLIVRFGEPVDAPAPGWVEYAALAAICCAQLLRTRAPVAGLLAGVAVVGVAAPLVGLSIGVLYVLSDLLYSATLNSSARANRVIIAVVGVLIVVSGVGSGVASGDWRLGLLTLLGVGLFPVIPVWWATEVRAHRALADAQRERADQLERIAELDRRAAVAAERARMARDLHDVIAGHLSAIAIQSEAALSMVDGDPQIMRTVLKSVRENSIASLTEMRAMIGLLRSDDPQSEPRTAPPRLADLEPLLDSARAAGLRVRAEVEPPPDLPAAVDLSAYRIVQEALTNAVKHAPGSETEVIVTERAGALMIDVTSHGGAAVAERSGQAGSASASSVQESSAYDRSSRESSARDSEGHESVGRDGRAHEDNGPDGPGIQRSTFEGNGGGTGLTNMQERAQAVGGVLVAGPRGAGWQVRAELPIPGAAR